MATRWLQVMFSLALVWALVPFPLIVSEWAAGRLRPSPYASRGGLNELLEAAVIAIAAVIVMALLRRFAPRFLHVPEDTAPRTVVTRFLLMVPPALVACFLFFAAISLVLEPPPWKSDNPQHVPVIFFLATLGPLLLTPTAAVIAAWWWIRRKALRAP